MLSRVFSFYWPTSDSAGDSAEARLLAASGVRYDKRLVPVARPVEGLINTLTVEQPTGHAKPTLVVAHGFGAGSGFWFRNLEALSQHFNVHAIDWLGCGNSSRPPFTARTPEAAEDFFVESLEDWRREMGLERFILMGHSLGGYLSAVYALRYPERVSQLVLVSPVGVPEPPSEDRTRQLPAAWRFVRWMWGMNVTPQGAIRAAGRYGPRLVDGYVQRRMAHLEDDHRDMLHEYIYHTQVRKGSGEYALNTILQPGAYARVPLMHRLPELKMPCVFMYGSHDWMDRKAGAAVREKMQVETRYIIVPDSGHHLYLDNPSAFNDAAVGAILELHEQSSQSQSSART